MIKTTQQPRVTLRISADLYRELVSIAEARDCTLQQALDFYLERIRQQAREEARQMQLASLLEPEPKTKQKRTLKPKAKTSTEAMKSPEPVQTVIEAVQNPKPLFKCRRCQEEFATFAEGRHHINKVHSRNKGLLIQIS